MPGLFYGLVKSLFHKYLFGFAGSITDVDSGNKVVSGALAPLKVVVNSLRVGIVYADFMNAA